MEDDLAKAERKRAKAEEVKRQLASAAPRAKMSKTEMREKQAAERAAKGTAETQKKAKAAAAPGAAGAPRVPAAGAAAPASQASQAQGTPPGPPQPPQQQPPQQQGRPQASSQDRKERSGGAPPPAPSGPRAAPQQRGGVLSLFSHLDGPRASKGGDSSLSGLHPAVVTLGLKYSQGLVTGANSRCVAMLDALKEVIADYRAPPNMSVARDLDRHLKPLIHHLFSCRPHSVTMGNAVKHLRQLVSALPPDMSDVDARAELLEAIDMYVHTNVVLAQGVVVRHAAGKICDGDTVLTFARSRAVEQALLEARRRGTRFKVVVVSCRPHNEGQQLVERLAAEQVDCRLVLLSSLSYVVASASKVLLGCSALFANGAALARAGTALVAMAACNDNKPVLFLAETHKFTDKVQQDAIVSNELGDPDRLVLPWLDNTLRDLPRLELLNLCYDLTPAEYIDMVITEFGMLPASSVPAIVREKGDMLA
jgi:translation initiation factor eIF-2B subunit delta